MSNSNNRVWQLCCGLTAVFMLTLGLSAVAQADLRITRAIWDADDEKLIAGCPKWTVEPETARV